MAAKRSAAEGACIRFILTQHAMHRTFALTCVALPFAAALHPHEVARGAEYTKLARAALDGSACYDLRLFITPNIDDKLVCTLCANVIRKARMVMENDDAAGVDDPCNCVVGGGCLSKSLAVRKVCPSCSRPFVRSDAFAKLDREVASLRVKCHVAPDECPASGELGPGERWWRQHEAVCAFALVTCPSCDAKMARRDLVHHGRNDCLLYRFVVSSCNSITTLVLPGPASDFRDERFGIALTAFVGLAKPAIPLDTAGCCLAIVRLMMTHKQLLKLQEIACMLLARLCHDDPSNRPLAGDAGACEAVVGALKTHGENRKLARNACRALTNLARNPVHRDRARAAGACEALVDALETHSEDLKLARNACCALANLACNLVNRDRAGAAGACEAVVDALETHGEDSKLSRKAFLALANLACTLVNRDRAGAAGACGAVVDALETHGEDLVISCRACRALAKLTQDHPTNKERAGAAGACEALVDALETHGEDLNLARNACRALTNLACNPVNKELAGAAGAFPALVAACTLHVADAADSVQVHDGACHAFSNMTKDHPANQQRAVEAGVIESVIASMLRFQAHADIQARVCSTLLNISSSATAHLPRMAAAGARAALASALQTHPGDDDVQERGAAVLARLAQY